MKALHLEGIRGICAFLVFMVHFWATSSVTFTEVADGSVNSSGFVRKFSEEILQLFFNGDLPVFIFWLMSAHVITAKFFAINDAAQSAFIKKSAFKRYFRFLLPVFTSSLIALSFLYSGLFYNSEKLPWQDAESQTWLSQWYNYEPSFFFFLRSTFFEVFLNGNCSYNPVLWTIQVEFLGSFLCFGLLAISGKENNRGILYSLVVVFLLIAGSAERVNYYYAGFVLGIMYSDLQGSRDRYPYIKKQVNSIWLPVVLLALSYTAAAILEQYLPELNPNIHYFFAVPLRAIGFLLLCINLNFIRKLVSTKPLVYFGKISFSFYLLHFIVLMSLGSYLYSYYNSNSMQTIFKVFAITFSVSFIASVVFEKFVDSYSKTFANRLANKIFKES